MVLALSFLLTLLLSSSPTSLSGIVVKVTLSFARLPPFGVVSGLRQETTIGMPRLRYDSLALRCRFGAAISLLLEVTCSTSTRSFRQCLQMATAQI